MSFVRRSSGLRFAETTHGGGRDLESQGRGPGYAGVGNPGRVRGKPERGECGQSGRADLIQGWRDCRCSSGCGKRYATLRATRRNEGVCLSQLGVLCTPSHQSMRRVPRQAGCGRVSPESAFPAAGLRARGAATPRDRFVLGAWEGRWGAKENQQVLVPSGLQEARGGGG